MLAINKLLAKISLTIALVLIVLWVFTPLWHSAAFSLFVMLWGFITLSSLYRVTPLFVARNPITDLLKRDVNQLALISLAGLFDFKRKAEFVLIGQIKQIEIGEGIIHVTDVNDQLITAVLSVNSSQINSHLAQLLSERERAQIDIRLQTQ
ncbi:hypothetical protein MKZ42_15025 [Pseudoalteromonas shioyasakiensis]|uniref:DUF304 domain-containing protein n=1 Tax=Pseudoalteromonas shioyasakiensis TaxID=1190813 RepID=A0ABT6U113_9GAMM|nr:MULTISPECIES: hypothetical protein [Pseudoalteromonas]MDI4652406.1 hypothetical protein [Pseudoalteromonas shioyasakiensis]MDI4669851.1 hypothetical protein [Pseudoalteromonas shioyasakiensis]MDI4674564.1 hypothetical protein [Pseudoalteromonas shioyasakiensis]MDI4686766.1 hypothetical protein [Pseudoalteromonas shioyasakiensis]MDI4705361.1 hypothetical protein [Pseudoalteromonas shioyasakiensis]